MNLAFTGSFYRHLARRDFEILGNLRLFPFPKGLKYNLNAMQDAGLDSKWGVAKKDIIGRGN